MKKPPPDQLNLYGVFYGQINEGSVQRAISKLAEVSNQTKHLHLLFQSTGGRVTDGICLYNFLRTYPIELSIYNSGSVQSIAAIVFLAPRSRIVDRHATFMIHRALWLPTQHTPEESMASALQNMKMENARIGSILRGHINMSRARFSNLGSKELWFSASDAVKVGIASRIGKFSPTPGARIHNFGF